MNIAETLGLDKTTTGYGAVMDGMLSIQTVTHSRNAAALNAFYIHGHYVQSCDDPSCDCVVKALAEFYPNDRIVAVTVRVDG